MKHNQLLIYIIIVIGLLTCFGWFTAFKQAEINQHRPQIAANIYPLYDMVRTIGGSDLPVDLLIAPGSNKMKSITSYQLIFSTTNLDNPDTKIIVLDKNYLDLTNIAYYLDTIAGALSEFDPSHISDYQTRAAIYKQQLLELVAKYPSCDYHRTSDMDPIGGSIDKDTFYNLMKTNLEKICQT